MTTLPSSNKAKATSAKKDESSSVQVAIRIRPMLASEAGNTQCVEVLSTDPEGPPNVVRIGGDKGPTFTFDHAFDGHTPQHEVYQVRVMPLIESCLEGYNATTLAYGQTGSGKTFSMMGPSMSSSNGDHAGIIPRAIQSIFDALKQFKQERSPPSKSTGSRTAAGSSNNDDGSTSYEYEVRIQFLELYGEEIRDLLTTNNKEKLVIRDYGSEPEVVGATQHAVDCPEEALLCMTRGMLRRVTGSTAMNATSSRSHAILSILIEQTTTSNNNNSDSVAGVLRSKFNFVDLAGSERVKRTQAEGKRLKEGIDINKGLLVLGNVISALGDPKKGRSNSKPTFVPYRDSKLTRLLKGSLGGNHKTLMIACVSPSSSNLDESLNCLRYANRAKNIQNNAIVNVDAGTRLVAELRQQVSALATELLNVKTGDEEEKASSFSVEVLQELINKGHTNKAAGGFSPSTTTPLKYVTPMEGKSYAASSSHDERTSAGEEEEKEQRLQVSESQLEQTRGILRKTTDELNSVTEDLFTVRAERELYRLRLETSSSESNGKGGIRSDKGSNVLDTAFLEKAAAYEREIATLKEAVQARALTTPPISPPEDGFLARTTEALQKQKAQLQHLQSELQTMSPKQNNDNADTDESDRDGEDDDDAEMEQLRSQVMQSMSSTKELEAEEDAAAEELSALTKKFLPDDEDNEENAPDLVNEQGAAAEDDLVQHQQQQQQLLQQQQQQKLEVDLVELSKSIDEKEVLIDQLQLSQQKYANMRAFYEEKLQHMEDQVREREAEREALIAELLKAETSGPRTRDLEKALRDKERHISGLKKRQTELVNLTKVSSTNEGDIDLLKNEITNMKSKKVELQKMINSERKSHVGELNRLKKEVMLRDREANKWKRISDKKRIEAEKSQQVAKSRLEQIGVLKAKYTEAEKKLRVKTVKRGVMEKAGLDNVIVGRRTANKATSKRNALKPQVDVDSVRDFLDKKVADVGKKEATADKLAHEWEDHLELLSKKQTLKENRAITRASKEAIKKLDVQLQFKEERIRKLAERIGKQPTTTPGSDEKHQDIFFESEEFRSLLPEASTLSAAKLTSRVLFGMVVRERRRVASLARTASTLNEKALEAEQTAAEKDAAFRSYREEERADRTSLAISQQEHILSLMAMVQEEDSTDSKLSPGRAPMNLSASMPNITTPMGLAGSNSRMAVLANEKVEALERQLCELRGERESMEMYRAMEAEARSELSLKNEEIEKLREGSDQLRETLRRIRESVAAKADLAESSPDGDIEEAEESILALVTSTLKSTREMSESTSSKFSASKSLKSLAITHSESEDEDEEIPEWAGDIMADLAVIAEGQIPEALLKSPEFEEHGVSKDKGKGSVFDRLTNPSNFTGVQKRRSEQNARRGHQAREKKYIKPMNFEKGQEERKAMSQKVSEQLEDFFQAPNVENTRASSSGKSEKSRELYEDNTTEVDAPSISGRKLKLKELEIPERLERRSVFERLLSPSMYTGTQKEKIKEEQAKKSQEAEELLDDLLASTHGSPAPALAHFEPHAEPKQPEVDITTQVANKVSEYTQKDVFERLQRTTTQSYAVKHIPAGHGTRALASPLRSASPTTRYLSSPTPVRLASPEKEAPDNNEPVHLSRRISEIESASPLRDRSSYSQQNVFERLQKTSTHAFAKKKNPDNEMSSTTTGSNTAPTRFDPPISADDHNGVFERLQNTTTHSFAGKQHRDGDAINHA